MSSNGKASEKPRRHASTGLYVRSASGLKLRDRKVQRLVRSMRVVMPWLEDSDLPACRAWAQLEILSDQAFAVLRTIGTINRNGEPRRLLTDFRQLRQAQLAFARELGMTPAARMAIKANSKGVAFDVQATPVAAEPTAEERQAFAKQVLACLIECRVIQLPKGIQLPEGVVTSAPSDAIGELDQEVAVETVASDVDSVTRTPSRDELLRSAGFEPVEPPQPKPAPTQGRRAPQPTLEPLPSHLKADDLDDRLRRVMEHPEWLSTDPAQYRSGLRGDLLRHALRFPAEREAAEHAIAVLDRRFGVP